MDNYTTMTPIREKIALRIKKLGISKKNVCDDLGLTQQNFSTFLTGKRGFPLEDVERLLMYLGLTVKDNDYKAPRYVENPNMPTVQPGKKYAVIRISIRLRMKDLGLSVGKLSEDTGINKASLSSYFSGKRGMNVAHIECIMHQLGLTLVPKEGFVFRRLNDDSEETPSVEGNADAIGQGEAYALRQGQVNAIGLHTA